MMRFLRAHGADPGPTQRPMLAGALTGLAAALPAAAVFVGFGSFEVAADEVMRLPRPLAAALMLAAFTLAGLIYGRLFGRAANDPGAGWMLGLAYGFLLWIAAPMVVLPLLRGPAMAAGTAATGFLAAFLVWGLVAGVLFRFVHRPLHAGLDGDGGRMARIGPSAGLDKLLRRPSR